MDPEMIRVLEQEVCARTQAFVLRHIDCTGDKLVAPDICNLQLYSLLIQFCLWYSALTCQVNSFRSGGCAVNIR